MNNKSQVIEVTLSLDTAQYADGDLLAAPQEVANAVSDPGGVAMLTSVVLLDKDDQAAALDLVFMRTSGSLGTENSAAGPTDAVADEICGVIAIAASDYVDLANSQIVTKVGSDAAILMNAASGSSSLYVGAISRGTGTYTAAGITLKLGFLQD